MGRSVPCVDQQIGFVASSASKPSTTPGSRRMYLVTAGGGCGVIRQRKRSRTVRAEMRAVQPRAHEQLGGTSREHSAGRWRCRSPDAQRSSTPCVASRPAQLPALTTT